MKVIRARNVHEALPLALHLLDQEGVERGSRNGPVLLGPPVTTVYERPCERVLFWSARDANPFFHLYESLWMLAGRRDVAGPAKYAKNILNYSDDGEHLHGAYGGRWIDHFGEYNSIHRETEPMNQLWHIAEQLKKNPDDRRCVLQMWDPSVDLSRQGKDVPCNLEATFQRGFDGELNLTVFCRSNDIIWGAYGANAVHFSFLLEYMALWIGCPVGTYTQISVNWHGYLSTLKQVEAIRPDMVGFIENPYIDRRVHWTPMEGKMERICELIDILLMTADKDHLLAAPDPPDEPWAAVVHWMLKAHESYRVNEGVYRYQLPLAILAEADQQNDWIVAGTEWMQRRLRSWEAKQGLLTGDLSHR